MASNYSGVDQFSPSLALLTDGDPPMAATWRSTYERLLDNDVHQENAANLNNRLVRARNALVMFKVRSGDPDNPGMAAYTLGKGGSTVLVKAGSSNGWRYPDVGYTQVGDLASITALVEGVAYNPTAGRLVAIGGGGNNNATSTNFALNWSAGGAIGGACHAIVWNHTHSRFVVSRQAGNTIHHSADAASWTSVATSLATDVIGGIAVLSGGNMVVCGADTGSATNPAFSRSTNGGTSWADTGGTVADVATYDETGWVVGRVDPTGAADSFIYHVGRRSGGTTLRVSRSADGTTWETIADLPASLVQAGQTYTARPRLRSCPNTPGMLVITVPFNSSVMAMFASLDGGLTWSPPVTGAAATQTAYTLAGGRMFMGLTTETFASIGVGL